MTARAPRPAVPGYWPLVRNTDTARDYERQEMLAGREHYATGDHSS